MLILVMHQTPPAGDHNQKRKVISPNDPENKN